MRKCYSWVWIKHAIRVQRNRNYIWYCYTANLNLHSLKVAKVDLFPLLFRLSSRFHCMGYSSRRLWIKKKKGKSNWTVIALLHRNWEWLARLLLLCRELFLFFFERWNNYDEMLSLRFLFIHGIIVASVELRSSNLSSVSSLKSCFEFRVDFRERPLVNQKILINGISSLFNLRVTLPGK